jgi:hypothetical protein
MFLGGREFPDMKVYRAETTRNIELKVWEAPVAEAVYVLGVDPAYGENENNDRSAIQVLRCFADGIDQVAEYAYPMITTRHFAHVVAGIMAWYGNEPLSEVYYMLEINGPGGDVLAELKALKFQIENGYAPMMEQGLRNIFANVKQFMYARPDSMTGSGSAWHWKMGPQNKESLLEGLRGYFTNEQLRIRSHDLIEEMKTITRDGASIAAEGNLKDDRVIAMAMAVHYWSTKIRRNLIVQKRTREAEAAKKMKSIVDQTALFNANMLSAFMGQKAKGRLDQQRLAAKQAWRYGRR